MLAEVLDDRILLAADPASQGGHVDSGFAIHDMLRFIESPVATTRTVRPAQRRAAW